MALQNERDNVCFSAMWSWRDISVTRSKGFFEAPQTPLTVPLSLTLTLRTEELSLSAMYNKPEIRSKEIPDGCANDALAG